MSAGHSPGPWAYISKDGMCLDYDNWRAVSEENGGSQSQPIHDARGKVVALAVSRTSGPWGRIPDTDANAALIASAPDLLAERDRLKAMNAELAEALTFCAAALRHALAVMPIDDLLLRKTEAIEQAARAALTKHQGATT